MDDIKTRLLDDIKAAMRAKDMKTLTILRSFHAAIKQKEIDGRIEGNLSYEDCLQVLNTMIKQRREAAEQYREGKRDDLAQKEENEITIYQNYLPEQLSEDEITGIIHEAISNISTEEKSQGMKAMGQIMGQLKSKLQGKADMSKVSQMIKALLSESH